MITRVFITIAFFIAGGAVACAQSVEVQVREATAVWTRTTGVYVPAMVQRSISLEIEASRRREVLTSTGGGVRSDTGSATIAGVEPPGKVISGVARQRESEEGYASADPSQPGTIRNVALWLERFPTIRVVVQPTPPKDFLLTINGESCPSTEKAMYRVPVGEVKVRVWRPGTSICEKTYNTSPGSAYEVQCTF